MAVPAQVELRYSRWVQMPRPDDVRAKVAGVVQDGSGPHRLIIGSDAGTFTDPDEFKWECTPRDSVDNAASAAQVPAAHGADGLSGET